MIAGLIGFNSDEPLVNYEDCKSKPSITIIFVALSGQQTLVELHAK